MTLARKMDGFWTDCERRTLVPLNNGAKTVRVFDIGSITTDEWSYSQLLLYSGIIIPEDSGAVICIAKLKSPDRLGVNPLDMPRTPYRASEGNHSQSPPPCSITPPSYRHLYIMYFINGLHWF